MVAQKRSRLTWAASELSADKVRHPFTPEQASQWGRTARRTSRAKDG